MEIKIKNARATERHSEQYETCCADNNYVAGGYDNQPVAATPVSNKRKAHPLFMHADNATE